MIPFKPNLYGLSACAVSHGKDFHSLDYPLRKEVSLKQRPSLLLLCLDHVVTLGFGKFPTLL